MIRSVVYQLCVVFGVVLVLVIGGVMYTRSTVTANIKRNNQVWCDLLNALDSPDNPPPDNARSLKISQSIHSLRLQYGCKEV